MSYLATKTLQTEQEYHEAMVSLERVFSTARKGTPEGDEFELLSLLISDWESRNVKVERSTDPIGLIRYAMENRGMKVTDLAPVMPRGRAYEVLNKRRALTINMIRWFHENLQLPLEVLTQPYALDRG
jgi:HTH-type transcriptional regulator/antitoxin HigA